MFLEGNQCIANNLTELALEKSLKAFLLWWRCSIKSFSNQVNRARRCIHLILRKNLLINYEHLRPKRYGVGGSYTLCCTLKNEQTVLQNIPLQGAERAIAVTGTQFPQRKNSGLKGTRPVSEPRSAEGTMILPLIWGRRIRTPSRMAMISLVKRFGVCPRADPGPLEYRDWQPGPFGKGHPI